MSTANRINALGAGSSSASHPISVQGVASLAVCLGDTVPLAGFSVVAPRGLAGDMQLEVKTEFGTVTVQNAQATGNGTGQITLVGTKEEIEAALNSLLYTTPSSPGSDTISITVGSSRTSLSDLVVVAVLIKTSVPGLVGWWRAEGDANDAITGTSGMLLNGAGILSDGKVGETFNFDGVDDHVRIADRPELRFTNAMSVETWVNPASISGNKSILHKWDAIVGIDQRSYGLGMFDGKVYFGISANGLDSGATTVMGSTTLPVNQWSHLVATYDGSVVRLYVNGVLEAESPHTGGIFAGNCDVGIGGAVGGLPVGQVILPFPGRIDEASLYGRALSESEVQALYKSDSAGKCGP